MNFLKLIPLLFCLAVGSVYANSSSDKKEHVQPEKKLLNINRQVKTPLKLFPGLRSG